MVLSEDKINHLSHRILQALEKDPAVEQKGERSAILRSIKRVILASLSQDDVIDALIRKKLGSYTRAIVEGSSEWDILYHKMFQEEMKKKGIS